MRLATPARLAAAGLLTLSMVLAGGAAHAHGDRDRAERMSQMYDAGLSVPFISSPNVRLAAMRPGSAGVSGCFLHSAPYFVMSGLDDVTVYDISDPVAPREVGSMPSAQFENEAMNCGERKVSRERTERFAMIGVDLYQASPDDLEHVNDPVRGDYELVIVDVTDPTSPHVRSRVSATTSTHTVTCIDGTDCRYAYSAGDDSEVPGQGSFSVFDLTDLDNPVEVDSDAATAGIQPFRSDAVGWGGHKWNVDAAGYATHTGAGGSYIYDVRDPLHPVEVANTGAAGDSAREGAVNHYNDFIHHNSFRPNAKAFRAEAPPSLANGNILLVTEEDYEDPDCSTAGSFQTWHVKRLDGSEGSIVPLAKLELADLGTYPLPVGTFCSAHWFDYHPSGVVAVGFYGGGTQLIDVTDPAQPVSHGHASWGASEVWDSMWVPVYNRKGVATSQRTNLVYSVDLVRGLDVYVVDVPGDGLGTLPSVGSTASVAFAPVLFVGGSSVVALLVHRRRRRA
ncbi:hypothetical protein [Nocardioides astragali]|uniref:LVIVD repeat-containing protein n=1 Tax=Nocardioides astragali TaxID=1776736 RepID=A0ABW2N6K2_9ACTN|nr:hypothetical protein [Nocardioides astragali]